MSLAQTRQREKFRNAAKICSERVANLPKGQKLRAFRICMSQQLRSRV